MKKSYWSLLSRFALMPSPACLCIVLTAIGCFGFTIANPSMGIDDCAGAYYTSMECYGNMVQQGRLLHMVLEGLTGMVEFIPFFPDFLAALLFTGSAFAYCALFQYVTGEKLSTASLVGFACVYISCSILAEKYIFQLDVISTLLSYLTGALGLMYAYRFVREKALLCFPAALALLTVSLGSYESFAFLYVCGVFALFLLEALYTEEGLKLGRLLWDGIKMP